MAKSAITDKINTLRITQRGLKAVLSISEVAAQDARNVITMHLGKLDDEESLKKACKGYVLLAKARKDINVCQKLLKETKKEISRLNRQHDIREKMLEETLNGCK